MKCPRVLQLLQPLLDRELSEPVAGDLRSHLDTCAACGREYGVFRSLDRALADEPTIDPPSTLARATARRAAARYLTAKRLLLPAWLEALTLGGATVALGAGGLIGVSLLSAVFDFHLSPAMTAAGVAAVIATGLAAFSSSFYGADV